MNEQGDNTMARNLPRYKPGIARFKVAEYTYQVSRANRFTVLMIPGKYKGPVFGGKRRFNTRLAAQEFADRQYAKELAKARKAA